MRRLIISIIVILSLSSILYPCYMEYKKVEEIHSLMEKLRSESPGSKYLKK